MSENDVFNTPEISDQFRAFIFQLVDDKIKGKVPQAEIAVFIQVLRSIVEDEAILSRQLQYRAKRGEIGEVLLTISITAAKRQIKKWKARIATLKKLRSIRRKKEKKEQKR